MLVRTINHNTNNLGGDKIMACYENSFNTSQGKRTKLFVCAINSVNYVAVSQKEM